MNDLQQRGTETAQRLLAQLRPLFDHSVAGLAASCALDGKLQSDRMDER